MAAGDLITLSQLKVALGEDPAISSPKDGQRAAAISSASALIRAWTGLTLESGNNPPSTRDFFYDNSGYLDVNECHSITAVTSRSGYTSLGDVPVTLTTDEYLAYPLNSTVKLWLVMPGIYGFSGGSPEMGFTRNLDQYPYWRFARPNIIAVTATWGWPVIPADIQQAVIWTALSIGNSPGEPYRSESIENYSRTRGPEDSADPIPARAKAILEQYIIPRV